MEKLKVLIIKTEVQPKEFKKNILKMVILSRFLIVLQEEKFSIKNMMRLVKLLKKKQSLPKMISREQKSGVLIYRL